MQILRTAIALISALVGMLLALPVLLGTLLFWAVARVTQMLATRLEPRFLPWRDLVEFDDSVGWVPKSNVDVHYLAVRDPELLDDEALAMATDVLNEVNKMLPALIRSLQQHE